MTDAPQNEEEQTPQAKPVPTTDDGIPLIVNGRVLGPIEIDALREAKLRREKEDDDTGPKEVGGAARDTDPSRYGDWEKNGRAIDFS